VAGDGEPCRPLPAEVDLTACIPLKLGGDIVGGIVVFRLLGHKGELTRVDREVFELLATHAATALYCSGLHTQANALRNGRGS